MLTRREFLEAGAALAMLQVFAGPSWASPAVTRQPRGVVLTNVTLIDAVRPEPQRGMTVVARDGRIVRVGNKRPTGSERRDALLLDLQGMWLLPGLCDAHSHLVNPLHAPGESRLDCYIRMGKAAIDALHKGVTSLRVLGAPDYSDVAWRNAFARGVFQGPRLVAGGRTIVATAGHGASYDYGHIEVADGPEAVRRAVRVQIENDVDQIKLIASGGVFGRRWDNLDYAQYSRAEIEAALDAARERGLKVAVHAGNPESVKRAVQAGAFTIEHGYILDEECIRLMRDAGTIFVPTLCVTGLTPRGAESAHEKEFVRRWPMPPELFDRADERRPAHWAAFRAALEAGVKIASGPDHSPPAETVFLEIEALARAGMSPMQAIVAATRTAAEAAGLEAQVGSVEVGKVADLLVVGADPLESVAHLRRTTIVIKEGEVVADYRKELQQ